MRGKDYGLLDLQEVQTRLALPPDQQTTHPETGTCRALFDCPNLHLTPTGPRTRVIVATHPATATSAPIGTTRGEIIYELFYTALPVDAFTPADVVALYLHRGAFETVLAGEDQEQDPDRWCSHTAWGQEFWLILAQWIWNLRLELGHALHPTAMRTTEFAPAQLGESEEAASDPVSRPPELAPVLYGPPQWARPSYTKGFAGADFSLQPDGTLRCPAGRPLYAQERHVDTAFRQMRGSDDTDREEVIGDVSHWTIEQEEGEQWMVLQRRGQRGRRFPFHRLYSLIGYGYTPQQISELGLTKTAETTRTQVAHDDDGEFQRQMGLIGREGIPWLLWPEYSAIGSQCHRDSRHALSAA